MTASARPHKRVSLLPYLYLLPALVLFGMFVFLPFFKTVATSFFMTDPTGRMVSFVGLENDLNIFASRDFGTVMSVTFEFAVKVVIGSITMGVFAAILANEVMHFKGLFCWLFTAVFHWIRRCAVAMHLPWLHCVRRRRRAAWRPWSRRLCNTTRSPTVRRSKYKKPPAIRRFSQNINKVRDQLRG